MFAIYPSLENKVVFITGGTSGIGADFVLEFAKQGAKVAFIGRNQMHGEELCERVEEITDQRPLYIQGDLSKLDDIHQAIYTTVNHFKRIDVLINNAANDVRHHALEVTEEMWNDLMAINLKHQFFTAQAVLPFMMKNKSGSIINMSSNSVWLAELPSYPLYTTAKAAIIGLTRSLAREFGVYNIRVNCIEPGWIFTAKQIEKWVTPEGEAQAIREQSLKHRLYPEDVSRLALFLAADDSKMITKQIFVVDGGRI